MPALIRRGLAGAALAAAALCAGGCEGEKDLPPPPTPGQGRNNAVTVAAKDAGPATTPTAPAPQPPATAPQAPRQLCAGQAPRPAPSGAVSTMTAAGAQPLPAAIGFGVGKWVWLNFWAAWCKPCKEEMPRLLGWQQKLRAAGVLVDLAFVSLDDDERQLQRFLEEQPGTGVRASYWLPEGAGRTAWLTALGMRDTPELPVHAIVAPGGQVTCTIQGAVEDRDYPAMAAFLGAKR